MKHLSIQDKANDFIHQSKILDILQKYGKPTLIGSYRMQVMVWNDLDFYIDLTDFHTDKYYSLAAELITKLKPSRFDGIFNPDKNSFFIGFELIFAKERWNIDIWWKTKAEIDTSIRYTDELISQMKQHPHLKQAVLEIKQELINRKLYGFDKVKHHYHSNEIYDAVFQEGILTVEEFATRNK